MKVCKQREYNIQYNILIIINNFIIIIIIIIFTAYDTLHCKIEFCV